MLTAALKVPGENSLIKLLSPESPAGVQPTLNAYFPKGCGQSGGKIGLNLDTISNLIIIDTSYNGFEFSLNITNDENRMGLYLI